MSRYSQRIMKNNVHATLSTPISSLATTIQLTAGQGSRFGNNFPQLATLENIVDGKVMKREIVRIISRTDDNLTVERHYAPCPADDDANTQSQISFSFNADDTISLYITKEHFDEIGKSIDDLYNNGNDRLYVKSVGGLDINITGGIAKIGDDYAICNGGNFTLTDNATNYIMINSAGNIVVNTTGRIDENCRLATITTASGEITNIEKRKIDTAGGQTSVNVQQERYYTLDNVVKGDILTLQTYDDAIVKSKSLALGDTIKNYTKLAIKIYGSGIVGDRVSTYIIKNGSGQVLTARIETDDTGKPSGTLASASATGTVQTADISSNVDDLTEIVFDGSFSLSVCEIFRLVLSVPTTNASNYLTLYGTASGDLMAYDSEWKTPTGMSSSINNVGGADFTTSGDIVYNVRTREFTATMSKTIYLERITNGFNGGDPDPVLTIKEGDTLLYTQNGGSRYNLDLVPNANIYLYAGHTYTFHCEMNSTSNTLSITKSGPDIFSSISGTICGVPSNIGAYNFGFAMRYKEFVDDSMKTTAFGDIVLPNFLKKVTAIDFDHVYDKVGIAMSSASTGSQVNIATGGIFENVDFDLLPGQEYMFDGTDLSPATNSSNKIYLGEALSKIALSLKIKLRVTGNGICHITGLKGGTNIVVKGENINGEVLKGF